MVSDDNLMGTTNYNDGGDMGDNYNDGGDMGDMGDMDFGKAFSTESLLTRDFQKSVAYQNYIFTKGGEGSGAQPGHPFNGNQWTGGMQSVRQKDGTIRRVGWKTRIKEYGDSIKSHTAIGDTHVKMAKMLEAQGKHAEAANEHAEAAKRYERAAGAARGISNLHKEYADKGHPDASLDTAKAYYDLQTSLRENQKQGSLDTAERLKGLAAAA
jgi:hypothetical protein